MTTDDDQIEAILREMFEKNFERLHVESGHGLSPDVKKMAYEQVLLYWRKLRQIAETITDTEVRLNLTGQQSPEGRKFGIEGVVDIVREKDQTVMYDIKTHDLETIQSNLDVYEKQLNVYAYIWQNLRGERLNETAIIATQLPEDIQPSVEQILEMDDREALEHALANWNPIVPIQIDPHHVDETIQSFGAIVDKIEGGCFDTPPLERLSERDSHSRTFATRVCRNCDARFSCDVYRDHTLSDKSGKRDAISFRRYYEDFGEETDREFWRDAALPDAPSGKALASDI